MLHWCRCPCLFKYCGPLQKILDQPLAHILDNRIYTVILHASQRQELPINQMMPSPTNIYAFSEERPDPLPVYFQLSLGVHIGKDGPYRYIAQITQSQIIGIFPKHTYKYNCCGTKIVHNALTQKN